MKIGDGYATVTGYKLPKPLVPRKRDWEGGSEVQAPSQDIGLAVLVAVPLSGTNFSVKRRMRPARLACARRDSLNAFILRFAGVWRLFVFRSRTGLSIINPGSNAPRIERSALCSKFVCPQQPCSACEGELSFLPFCESFNLNLRCTELVNSARMLLSLLQFFDPGPQGAGQC